MMSHQLETYDWPSLGNTVIPSATPQAPPWNFSTPLPQKIHPGSIPDMWLNVHSFLNHFNFHFLIGFVVTAPIQDKWELFNFITIVIECLGQKKVYHITSD
ncbi:unnamed protein product [Meganyctiphanes norvegica]|uniref:Uncharacterized protein n=1 Tax=Meganyctiphanes norvegica TaxID=48144 RepID=A0AAV2Q6E5_MEGNR